MKTKILLLSAGLVMFGMNVTAQDDSRDQLKLGIKAGINNSNVWDEEGQDFTADSKNGFAGGAFLSIPIGTYLGIQPEVLYSQKGYQGTGSVFGTRYTYTRTSEYIDVPIMLQFKPSPFITFLGGPTYSFLTRQTDVVQSNTFTQEEQTEFDNQNLRKNTLGATLGADINLSNFVIAPRFGWDFQTNHGDGTSSSPRYRNQWLQLAVGYRF